MCVHDGLACCGAIIQSDVETVWMKLCFQLESNFGDEFPKGRLFIRTKLK